MNVHDLPTPALLFDAHVLQRNIEAMSSALPGTRLRPHVKAHKCTALAARQQAAGHDGFTCATPREVVGMAAAGVGTDLLLANETVDPIRLRAMADLDVAVTVAVDSAETVRAAVDNGIRACLVDVDVGLPRCGVSPDDAGRLADLARSRGLEVRGVMGYEGHLMMIADRTERKAKVDQAMELLRRAHRDVGGDVVSAGGTGTFDLHGDTGATEVQAGSYVLMDSQYGLQRLGFEQGLSVLGTVISVSTDWAVADVGLKALGMDHGNPTIEGCTVWFCSDEHITFSSEHPTRVGDRVKVAPAHIDPTIALHDRAHVVDGEEVSDEWPIDLRGW